MLYPGLGCSSCGQLKSIRHSHHHDTFSYDNSAPWLCSCCYSSSPGTQSRATSSSLRLSTGVAYRYAAASEQACVNLTDVCCVWPQRRRRRHEQCEMEIGHFYDNYFTLVNSPTVRAGRAAHRVLTYIGLFITWIDRSILQPGLSLPASEPCGGRGRNRLPDRIVYLLLLLRHLFRSQHLCIRIRVHVSAIQLLPLSWLAGGAWRGIDAAAGMMLSRNDEQPDRTGVAVDCRRHRVTPTDVSPAPPDRRHIVRAGLVHGRD